jgi:tetratricopeptide (TPR) repeat protein
MARGLTIGVAICLVAGLGSAQVDSQRQADSRTVLGGGNEFLAAGAELIRAGQYAEGIRLTTLGLEHSPSINDKAAALSNLCAAHAAKGDPDLAITFCTESIAINENNWRAYSNRSYAFYLKGMYAQANTDLEVAASISPNARQVMQIRGMINERNLRPSVIMEDHR